MNLNEQLGWRYAVKKFDADKKVDEATFDQLLETIRLSPSSYGLQAYQFIVIRNPELRQKLQPASWGQTQIVDASHMIVFYSHVDFSEAHIDDYLKLTADTRGLDVAALEGYGSFMKSKLLEMPKEGLTNWMGRQSYIAMGNLLTACAIHGIDTCPMEGIEADQYDQILGLSERNLRAWAVVMIGYRSAEDTTQHYAKVRKSKEDLFIEM